MRIPVPLAWLLLGLTFATAALLRRFHDRTPESPLVSPVVGSLLFAAIFVLLLISAREWRRRRVAGPGVRLGSLSPILLMLLLEKWISLTVYPRLFLAFSPEQLSPRLADAVYRALAGLTLIGVCLVIGRFSRPTMRKTWRRTRPVRWPIAALGTLVVLFGCYVVIGLLSLALGGGLELDWPRASPVLAWVLVGQAVLAFAEEIYYRGLLMCEMERLAPRLGIRNRAWGRWTALVTTAALFGLEHFRVEAPWAVSLRELAFVASLGVLFGILAMVSTNLHFVAGVHAWINWLLLGAAPHFVDGLGRPALPAGTYIGLTLVLAFVVTYAFRRWRRRQPVYPDPDRVLES